MKKYLHIFERCGILSLVAGVAQMVERVIGNDEVTGPIPVPSFFFLPYFSVLSEFPCAVRAQLVKKTYEKFIHIASGFFRDSSSECI